jgi:hypothetical protein
MDMKHTSRFVRPRTRGYRFASAFVLALALIAAGTAGRAGSGILSAQAPGPCALLTLDEIKPVASNGSIADGVPMAMPDIGYAACRYVWGEGINRFTLDVTTSDPAHAFAGMSPDQIKQQLLASVRPGTADAAIPEVGEAAVFRRDSPVYATAAAVVKGRLLQVRLDGLFAGERKDDVVGLMKSAAGRL